MPVARLNTKPEGTVSPGAKASVAFEMVAGRPFNVSPVKAFSTDVAPEAPFILLTVSSTASNGAAPTLTVTLVVLQFAGLIFSQI